MKINKKSPQHWLSLFRFTIVVIIGLVLRRFTSPPTIPTVILYGHKLNGNLKALYDYISKNHAGEIQIIFITMDSDYHQQLATNGITSANANSLKTAMLIAKTACVVSDHGLHSLELALRFSNIKFVDVWHGIPFKGFDASDFRTQQKYNQIWVSSTTLAQIYCDKFGFSESKIRITGYGRADTIQRMKKNKVELLQELKVPERKNIILYAPTWAQNAINRSLFPFGCTKNNFLTELTNICARTNSVLLIRTHLNSELTSTFEHPDLYFIPHSEQPETEKILAITDLLICDWSSVAFDFLVVERPTVFLDVPAPFKKGFSLPPDMRFGPTVNTINDLLLSIDRYIQHKHQFNLDYGNKIANVKRIVYGDTLDGESSKRYVHQLYSLFS